MPVDCTFQNPWEEYFTVVQWDQRGAGKTYASNDANKLGSTMTIAQMTSDAEEVVRYLQNDMANARSFYWDIRGAVFLESLSRKSIRPGSTPVAEEWFKHIKAPSKKFVWFDNSAHISIILSI
jgi:hypothetical protein